MKMKKTVIFVGVCFLLLMTNGCIVTLTDTGESYFVPRSETFKDTYQYQPFVNNGKTAQCYLTVIETLDLLPYIKWRSGLYEWSSDKVIFKSDSFLKNNNIFSWQDYSNVYGLDKEDMVTAVWDELEENELPDNDSYPWLRHRHSIYYSKTDSGKYIGYRIIKTIVCLKPLIVVISDGNILAMGNSRFIFAETEEETHRHSKIYGVAPESAVLKNGYAYGTRIPYDPQPQWFSPEMKVTPRDVEIDRDGRGFIDVPWGRLILTKHNDDWVVMAEKKK